MMYKEFPTMYSILEMKDFNGNNYVVAYIHVFNTVIVLSR